MVSLIMTCLIGPLDVNLFTDILHSAELYGLRPPVGGPLHFAGSKLVIVFVPQESGVDPRIKLAVTVTDPNGHGSITPCQVHELSLF